HQIGGLVDVMEHRQPGARPAQRIEPRQRGGRHDRRAPGDVLEQAGIEAAQPQQGIAAVGGGGDDRRRLAQRLRRLAQAGRIQPGAVGANQQDGLARAQDALRRACHARTEIALALRRPHHVIGQVDPAPGGVGRSGR
ncbi:hypothetical protein RZS08_39995, partial [Arthrospira platensis SPKY1]|nr:hypothetical protein [Arthrospira platensis SPKY1]